MWGDARLRNSQPPAFDRRSPRQRRNPPRRHRDPRRRIETRLSGVETRLGTLETVTARAPDLRLLGHQMATLIERVTGLEASNTRAIAALNDIARESVTPGEVEALHSEMNELRNAKFNHEVRIRQLGAELNIAPSS
jgi:hypothetical protein